MTITLLGGERATDNTFVLVVVSLLPSFLL